MNRGCFYLFKNILQGKLFLPICKAAYHTAPVRYGKLTGFIDRFKPSTVLERAQMKASGYYLVANVVDVVPYDRFFYECNLPDTFNSWFIVTELHIWMLAARLMAAGDKGKLVRNSMIEGMWHDVEKRSRQLAVIATSVRKESLIHLHEEFLAALISYDEGLQSDDIVLAGAVWRRMFERREHNPRNLENIVHYVRKQVKQLDEMENNALLLKPIIKWVPIV